MTLLWVAIGIIIIFFVISKFTNQDEGNNFIKKRNEKARKFTLFSSLKFADDFAPIKYNNKWGFINANGELVIVPKYDGVGTFSEGLCPVSVKNVSGFIDKEGNDAIPFEFESAQNFHQELAAVRLMNSESCYINKSGEVAIILDETVEDAWEFHEDRAFILKNGLYGYVNKTGDYVIEPKYTFAEFYSDSIACVRDANHNYNYIDLNGEITITNSKNYTLEEAQSFSENLAGVKIDGAYGFIDKDGNIAIKPIFDEVRPFKEGFAAVKNGTFWGFIDRTGSYVIKADYGYVSDFSNGLAVVYTNNDSSSYLAGYMDSKGSFVIPPQYFLAGDFYNDRALVYKENELLLIDKKGSTIKNLNKELQFDKPDIL